jgi:hypothetical protein
MDLQEVGCGGMDWIELAQGRYRLRWIFGKWDVGVWTGSNWLRIVIVCDGSLGSGMGGMDWIELAQYRNRWRAIVTAVMYLRVP